MVAQEVAQLRTKIGLLMKKFAVTKGKKVNIVGSRGKTSRHEDSYSKKEEKYLDREIVSF